MELKKTMLFKEITIICNKCKNEITLKARKKKNKKFSCR